MPTKWKYQKKCPGCGTLDVFFFKFFGFWVGWGWYIPLIIFSRHATACKTSNPSRLIYFSCKAITFHTQAWLDVSLDVWFNTTFYLHFPYFLPSSFSLFRFIFLIYLLGPALRGFWGGGCPTTRSILSLYLSHYSLGTIASTHVSSVILARMRRSKCCLDNHRRLQVHS